MSGNKLIVTYDFSNMFAYNWSVYDVNYAKIYCFLFYNYWFCFFNFGIYFLLFDWLVFVSNFFIISELFLILYHIEIAS
jgi:hypothetical protein